MITEVRALELAKAEFAKAGYSVNDYAVSIETDSTKWKVWFDRKGAYAVPGGNHLVKVEKTTGKTVFMKGE